MIERLVGVVLDGLVLSFNGVLVLMIGLGLPAIDEQGTDEGNGSGRNTHTTAIG